MPHTAVSRLAGGPLRCEVAVEGHTVVTDEPEDLGGTDTAATPQQLVAAALAACVSTTIEMYALRKQWDLGDARVEVCYDAECTEFDVTVHLPAALTDEQRERVMRVAGKCPVHRTLAAAARVTDRCEISA
jgi:putative redox protein